MDSSESISDDGLLLTECRLFVNVEHLRGPNCRNWRGSCRRRGSQLRNPKHKSWMHKSFNEAKPKHFGIDIGRNLLMAIPCPKPWQVAVPWKVEPVKPKAAPKAKVVSKAKVAPKSPRKPVPPGPESWRLVKGVGISTISIGWLSNNGNNMEW